MLISVFIILIHTIETLAYGTRLSGARIGFLALSLSLFNMLVIVSRMGNMVQQPFTGSLIDVAPHVDTLTYVSQQFRVIIGAATFGTLLGAILLPTFVALFSRAVLHLHQEKGSIPALLRSSLHIRIWKRVGRHIKWPTLAFVNKLNLKAMPVSFFLMNMLITAIYTIGVLSALYAALLAPDRAATAIMASGLVNGIATVLLVVFIDPKVSLLADEVHRNQGRYLTLRDVTGMLVISRVCGTLLAQLLFIPAAHYIAWLTRFIAVS
nr:lipid II flippase Amj family protein [Caldalkalibacillus salinus]